MKVVINAQHGGFSVSRKAFLRMRELGEEAALSEPDYGERWPDGSGPRKPFRSGGAGAFCRDIPRDSKFLLQVIEELGEEANGDLATLMVVEIPDDVDWEIQEYEGLELVAEKHRTWP